MKCSIPLSPCELHSAALRSCLWVKGPQEPEAWLSDPFEIGERWTLASRFVSPPSHGISLCWLLTKYRREHRAKINEFQTPTCREDVCTSVDFCSASTKRQSPAYISCQMSMRATRRKMVQVDPLLHTYPFHQEFIPHLQLNCNSFWSFFWIFQPQEPLPCSDHSALSVNSKLSHNILCKEAAKIPPRFASNFIRRWSECEPERATRPSSFKYLRSWK